MSANGTKRTKCHLETKSAVELEADIGYLTARASIPRKMDALEGPALLMRSERQFLITSLPVFEFVPSIALNCTTPMSPTCAI
jgi:hypothetical protein